MYNSALSQSEALREITRCKKQISELEHSSKLWQQDLRRCRSLLAQARQNAGFLNRTLILSLVLNLAFASAGVYVALQ